jgi:predicted kinase
VILDWGLWSREERDRYRREARELGARVVLCLVDATREELMERLSRRNARAPSGTFHISESRLDQSIALFERPTQEEISLFDADGV